MKTIIPQKARGKELSGHGTKWELRSVGRILAK
jgi:hypothetical protein